VVPDIDETHPDVVALVEKAVADAEKTVIQLPPEAYLEVLEESIRDAEKKMRETNPDGPLYVDFLFIFISFMFIETISDLYFEQAVICP